MEKNRRRPNQPFYISPAADSLLVDLAEQAGLSKGKMADVLFSDLDMLLGVLSRLPPKQALLLALRPLTGLATAPTKAGVSLTMASTKGRSDQIWSVALVPRVGAKDFSVSLMSLLAVAKFEAPRKMIQLTLDPEMRARIDVMRPIFGSNGLVLENAIALRVALLERLEGKDPLMLWAVSEDTFASAPWTGPLPGVTAAGTELFAALSSLPLVPQAKGA